MLRTAFSKGMFLISLGAALAAGCDSGKGEDGVTGSADNLKGRGKHADDDATQLADAGTTKDPGDPPGTDPGDPPAEDDLPASCAALLCPVNSRCVAKEVQCIRAPCPPIATCEPIPAEDAGADEPPPATCAATTCLAGTECVETPTGAQCVERSVPACAAVLCKQGTTCIETPTGAQCVENRCTAKCSAGQHCEFQDVVCIKAPCLPVPTCVDDVDACATVRCKAGTHCVSTQPQCFTTPCPPYAECVPNEK